jgi:hypothetical protein
MASGPPHLITYRVMYPDGTQRMLEPHRHVVGAKEARAAVTFTLLSGGRVDSNGRE